MRYEQHISDVENKLYPTARDFLFFLVSPNQ